MWIIIQTSNKELIIENKIKLFHLYSKYSQPILMNLTNVYGMNTTICGD